MTKYIALAVSALLVGLDQAIKIWAVENLAEQRQMVVIPGLFNLTYVENRGVAFGLLQGKTLLITIAVCGVLAAALCLLLTNRIRDRFLIWTVSLIMAGGAGNLIDRVWRGFVVDYLDFSALFGFPVFNFADCCVVVGTLLLFVYLFRQERREQREAKSRSAEDAPNGEG